MYKPVRHASMRVHRGREKGREDIPESTKKEQKEGGRRAKVRNQDLRTVSRYS